MRIATEEREMLSEPKIITRDPQPYVAIPLAVQQHEIAQKAPPLVPEILKWVAENAEQAGAVFFNYTAMQPGRPMQMEVGVPVAKPVKASGNVIAGTLPGGRYATVTWIGPYDQLYGAHDALHQWLGKQSIPKQGLGDGSGTTLLEIYETDPEEVPDPKNWVTDIAFKLKD
jgi:effector-binding domain-containing protein